MWNPIEDICFKNTLFSVFPPYHVISISSEMLNHKREVASHCPVSFIILFQTFKGKFTYAHTLSFVPIFLCSFHVQVFAICLNYYWLFLQFIIAPQDLPEGSRTKQKIETIEGDWRLPELESFNCKRPEERDETPFILIIKLNRPFELM